MNHLKRKTRSAKKNIPLKITKTVTVEPSTDDTITETSERTLDDSLSDFHQKFKDLEINLDEEHIKAKKMLRYYENETDESMLVPDKPMYTGKLHMDTTSNYVDPDCPENDIDKTLLVIQRNISGALNSMQAEFQYSSDYVADPNIFLYHPSKHPKIVHVSGPNGQQRYKPGYAHLVKIEPERVRKGEKKVGRPRKHRTSSGKKKKAAKGFDLSYTIKFIPWIVTEENKGKSIPDLENMIITATICGTSSSNSSASVNFTGISFKHAHLVWEIIRSFEIIVNKCQPEFEIHFVNHKTVLTNHKIQYALPEFKFPEFNNLEDFHKPTNGDVVVSGKFLEWKINLHNLHKVLKEFNGDFHKIPINGTLRTAFLQDRPEKYAIRITWINEEQNTIKYTLQMYPGGSIAVLNSHNISITEQILCYLFMLIDAHKKILIQVGSRKIKSEESQHVRSHGYTQEFIQFLKEQRIDKDSVKPNEQIIEKIRSDMLEYFKYF